MDKYDRITFWVIEIIIISLGLFVTYQVWAICHDLPENYEVPGHSRMVHMIRLYRLLPEVTLSLIFMGTSMNLTALYATELKSFRELSAIGKIYIRLLASFVGLIVSYLILIAIESAIYSC